jgi:hypothetical protein
MNKTTNILLFALAVLLAGCTETEFDKVTLPTTDIGGEYVTTLELGALGITDVQHIRLFNTSFGTDSLWVEDLDFFESQVRVKLNDDNTFGVTNGIDILNGADVNITGKVFPENDSIHVEWTYLQVDIGLGPDDYVVTANGVLYNGITN